MEARDTVMNGEKLDKLFREWFKKKDTHLGITAFNLEAQADISFRAGQKDVCTISVSDILEEGRKEGYEQALKDYSIDTTTSDMV